MTSPLAESLPLATVKPPLGPDANSLPLEVFEAILGTMSFVDLPHFLQTSKAIYVHHHSGKRGNIIVEWLFGNAISNAVGVSYKR
jgi:hypothetical protein